MNARMFQLVSNPGDILIDDQHRYIYRSGKDSNVVVDSVTKIVGGKVDKNNQHIADAAALGTAVHKELEMIIDGKQNFLVYSDVKYLAHYLFNRTIEELGIQGNLYEHNIENGNPLVFKWEGNLIGGCPDAITGDTVIEFKTTSKASKTHKKQLLCYMEATDSKKGLIVYADPNIPCVKLKMGTKEYDSIKLSVLSDLHKYFAMIPIYMEHIDDESKPFGLYGILEEIQELKKKLDALEREKKFYIDQHYKHVIDKERDFIIMNDKIMGTVKVSKVFVNTKKVDYKRMLQDGVYDKYIEESTTSYVKCVKG